MDDREAEIEVTLTRLLIGDSLLELAAMMATYAVSETRRQCAESQRFARIVRVLDAEAADAVETVT